MPHAQALPRTFQQIGGGAHVLLSASQDDFGIAASNRLDRQVDCLKARSTNLVESEGRHRKRKSGSYRALTSRILPCGGGQNLPHDDLIDALRRYLRTVQKGT
ncbi:hypothetical protein FQZ97_1245410 [compost metagenome]